MIPRTLGRYEIRRELGRGGMGRVYLAHDPEIDRDVAIKVIEFDSLTTSREVDARRKILAEAQAAGRLLHPSIVALFDVGETEDALYLAMEYVEGTTLDAYCVTDNLLPVATVVDMVAGVAEALDYAHESGIVHRDIKPQNVMRVGDSSIKVMDFGLARPTEQQRSLGGTLIGTPSYMSPEQIRGDAVDGRGDLFSLAVVLFELLAGERPFPGSSVASVIYRVVNEAPRPLRGGDGRVPVALRQFVMSGLSKDPGERCPTGAEFARALRAAAEAGVLPAAPSESPVEQPAEDRDADDPSPSPVSSPKQKPSSRAFVVGLVALVAVLITGAWLLRDRLGVDFSLTPHDVWWEATVRTEPEGLPILLDGEPLDASAGGVVRFRPRGPFGLLSAVQGCREALHTIDAADASGEIVLVLDPVKLDWRVAPGVDGATVLLNGENVGSTPLDVQLDLCVDNRVEVSLDGYREAGVDLAAGSTPLEARTALGALNLVPIPRGTVELPEFREMKLIYYVDGARLDKGQFSIELIEGSHEVRYKNDYFWIDERRTIDVAGGQTLQAPIELPALTTLVVQAFPSNCKVYIRHPGRRYRYVDDTPMRRRVAVGEYDVRVVLNPTGEEKIERVRLVAGENPPVRVAFRSGQ